MELAHRDQHPGDAVVDATHLGDARGEPFEQVVPLRGDHPAHGLGHRRVVDGVVERVARAGAAEVDGELDVDLEGLRPRLLLRQHAVHAELAQPLDDDGSHGQLRETMPSSTVTATISRATEPSWRPVIFSMTTVACGPSVTSPAYRR